MEIFADTKQTLVDILKKETETLRIKYLEMTDLKFISKFTEC
jgi:hypothetical protein